MHSSELIRKCSSRLYFLRQLKRSGVAPSELVQFYVTCIRPVLEYASPVFHRSLPNYISVHLERIQRRASIIIYPDLSYSVALETGGLPKLHERREKISIDLFDEMVCNPPTVSIASSLKGRIVNMHWDAKVISLSPYVRPSVWRTVLFLAMSIRCRYFLFSSLLLYF